VGFDVGCSVVDVGEAGLFVGETGLFVGEAGLAEGVEIGAVIVGSQQRRETPSEPGQQSPSSPAQSGCMEQLARFVTVGLAVFVPRERSNNEKSKVVPSSHVKAKSTKCGLRVELV